MRPYFSWRKSRLTTDLTPTLHRAPQCRMPPHGHISETFLGSSPPAFAVFVTGVLICPYLYVVIPMFLFEDSVCVDKIFEPVERWLCESQCSYMQIQVTSITVFCAQCLCHSWIPKRNWSFQAFSSVGIWKRGFFFILMEIWAVAKGTRRENLEFSLSWYFSLIFSLSTYLKHYENTIEPFLCCLLVEMSLISLQTVNVTKIEKVRNYVQGSGVLGSYSSVDQGPLDE